MGSPLLLPLKFIFDDVYIADQGGKDRGLGESVGETTVFQIFFLPPVPGSRGR